MYFHINSDFIEAKNIPYLNYSVAFNKDRAHLSIFHRRGFEDIIIFKNSKIQEIVYSDHNLFRIHVCKTICINLCDFINYEEQNAVPTRQFFSKIIKQISALFQRYNLPQYLVTMFQEV